ncbi:hypothetical protein JTE90_013308 [Oedothorax gibbosus]|uniref:Regulatory protein zeste n=2 Tax=Oedothorax gibbosus TaxID=931172 RepID=A0AAV6VCS2_9ARAC|nr:hypothetical protein JTE90_013308 [Oedothorax gibbosus]
MSDHLLTVFLTRRKNCNTRSVLSFPEHRAPTFTIEPATKVIFLNSSGESVHCAALGNPRPSITWVLADGTPVMDIPGLRLALANGTLLFLPFSAESYRQDIHASTYRCVAANLVGKISSRDIRIRAVVRQGYQVQVYDEFVIRGNTAVLRCQVPSIVRDYVIVTTWEREDGVTIVSNVANAFLLNKNYNMPKRAPRATPEQFEVMVNFMTEHSCLVHPKLSNSLPSTERDQLWEELCGKLNNQAFGPKKTTYQWRRVWTDLKSEVKDKLAEINKGGLRGHREELLNPCHNKVAKLLAKASSQCAFVEKQGLTVSSLTDLDQQGSIKFEESINFQEAYIEGSSVQPFVVSLKPMRSQQSENDSRSCVKCEEITENDSSDPEVLASYAHSVHSNEENQSLEDTANSFMPVVNKKKPRIKRKKIHKAVTEDTHLSSLVEAEKEKSKMLKSIADAISQSNEHQKQTLIIEEERNKLIQHRNSIESDRNDIMKSFLDHVISKGSR